MLTASSRLSVTQWTADLNLVQAFTLLGTALGLALGVSRFSPRLCFLLALSYGAVFLPWLIGAAQQSEPLWIERLQALALRMGVIIYQLAYRLPVNDSLLFLSLMSTLFWALSVSGGYAIARHGEAWKAILPAGVALFVIHYYDYQLASRSWYLAFYIFIALVLLARLAFVRKRLQWQQRRIALPSHLGLDFVRFTIVFSSLLVIFAWSAPSLVHSIPFAERLWQPVRQRWEEMTRRFDYAFASLRSTRTVISPIYGNSASLGRRAWLGDTLIFTVKAPANSPLGTRYYWRARTYDLYTNGQWFSSLDRSRPYDPAQDDLSSPAVLDRWVGEFEFTSSVQMGTLFFPGQLLWLSMPATLLYQENPDKTVDISSFIAQPTLFPGQGYRVRSSLSTPTIRQLRQAGTNYPEWVLQRYLQLPAEITPRTRQLAESLTAGLPTPYDKVAAITEYLRRNITYSKEIEGNPAPGQELVDWFLFDSKRGFCNYYATAEVILLRAVGIPARWSIGYAQGQAVETGERRGLAAEQITFTVRHKDAHAWPEVYFPGIGWVEFEPTAAQPELVRPSGLPPLPRGRPNRIDPLSDEDLPFPNPPTESTPSEVPPTAKRNLAPFVASMLAMVTVLAIVVWHRLGLPPLPAALNALLTRLGWKTPLLLQRWAKQRHSSSQNRTPFASAPLLLQRAWQLLGLQPPLFIRRWAQYAQLPPIARAYQQINRSLVLLGQPPHPDATPLERAKCLAHLLPSLSQQALALAEQYQQELFAQKPADMALALNAAAALRRASYWAFIRLTLKRLTSRPRRRKYFRDWSPPLEHFPTE